MSQLPSIGRSMIQIRETQWRRVSDCIAEASRGGEHDLLRAGGIGSEAAVFRSNVHRHGEQAGEQQPQTIHHRFLPRTCLINICLFIENRRTAAHITKRPVQIWSRPCVCLYRERTGIWFIPLQPFCRMRSREIFRRPSPWFGRQCVQTWCTADTETAS